MIRLAILLLTRRWGLIIIGALLLIGGLIYSASSHNVSYTKLSHQTVAHYLSGGGDNKAYMEMEGSSNLYEVNETSFTPAFSADALTSNTIDFVYRPDQTDSIDVTSTNTSTHLQGDAYTVEQITVYDSNGQNPKTYVRQEYQNNPNGFYENNWPGGLGLAFLGLVIGGLAFILPGLLARRRGQTAYKAAPAAGGAMPPNAYQQQPYSGQMPYQQQQSYPGQTPYAQPQQYIPPVGAGQFPPQYPQPDPYPQAPQPGGYPPYPQQQGQPGQYDPTQYGNPNNFPPQNR